MKIGKENIESFIFDYHEGNLSDSEKTELLNYIHTHPEYEAEFTQWAQSYLPFENTTENYGLTNKLLQPYPTLWYNKTWLKITAPILLCIIGSFFYFTSQESTVISNAQQANPTKEVLIDKKQITTTSELKNTQIKNTKSTPSYTSATSGIAANNTLQQQHTVDTSIASIHIDNTTPTAVRSSMDIQENKTTTSDSVTTNSNTVDTNIKTDVNKKKKSYKIKAATDFIPTNPDF